MAEVLEDVVEKYRKAVDSDDEDEDSDDDEPTTLEEARELGDCHR